MAWVVCSAAPACRREVATRLGVRPESRDQLAERNALAYAIEEPGVGQEPGSNAALRVALRAGNIPGQERIVRRPGFVDPLVHGGSGVLGRLHLRMILQRQRLGFVQSQLYRCGGLRQNVAGRTRQQ